MTKLGLLLGGGGSVGIAWENGVLAGLADAIGFDPGAVTVIVGTSAGAAVGADMALGRDPHDALDRDEEQAEFLGKIKVPDMASGTFAEIIGLLLSDEAQTPEGAARIGALAINAETPFSEDRFVERFRRLLGTDDWPAVDFRPTSCSCLTGQRKVWGPDDGIGLSRAVASSCAVPGIFPTVSFGGERFMDGSRGRNYHAAILEDVELDAAIYIGPNVQAVDMSGLVHADMAAIAATGVATHTMLGGTQLDAANFNLMDPTKRPEAFEMGKADGAAEAASFAALLAG